MSARKNTQASVLREACRAEFRAVTYKARHAARKPTRWTAAIAAAATAGAVAAAGGTAPWADAAAGLAADAHAVPGTGSHASVSPHSHLELTSRDLVVRAAVPQPADGGPVSAQPGTQHTAAAAARAAGHTTAGHPATAKAATAPKHSAARHAARPAAARHAAARPAHSKPFTLYDSVMPGAIPAGKAAALYSNGTYHASSAAVAGHEKVLWIDVNGSNIHADALDVEPGDATPAGAAAWVKAKLTADPNATAIVYTFKSAWGDVISNVNALPGWMHGHVRYWIADPTGTPHILPGATATQWYWGPSYDISSAAAGFTS